VHEKSILKNAIFNVLYRIMNMVFPLVTSIYVSHILMADGVGKVGSAQNIAQYFVLLAPLGLANYGTREIARIRNEKALADKIFSELFLINAGSTFVCVTIYFSLIFSSSWFAEDRLLFCIAGLPIVLNVFNVEWYYQGYEEYVYIAVRSVVVKLLSLVALFIFVKDKQDYITYALIYSLGIVGNYFFNVINLFKRHIKFQIKSLEFTCHFKPLFTLFASNLAIEVYTLLATTMLSVACNESIVGYYTNSVKMVRILVGLITAVGSILLPRLSYYCENNRVEECSKLVSRVVSVMIFLALPGGVFVYLLADILVVVMFGISFVPAIVTVQIGTILIYVLGFSNLFGTQVLLTFDQEKKLLLAVFIGAISNFVLNLILIPEYQHNGAMVASVISETIVTIMTWRMSVKYIQVKLEKLDIVKSVICTGIAGTVVWLVKGWLGQDFLSLIMSIVSGGMTYILLCLFFRMNIVTELFYYIRKR